MMQAGFRSKEELLTLTPEERVARLPLCTIPKSARPAMPYKGKLEAMNNHGVFGVGSDSVYVAPYLSEAYGELPECYLPSVTKIIGKNPRADIVEEYPHRSIVYYLRNLPDGAMSHQDTRKVALFVHSDIDWDALLGKDCYDLPSSTEFNSVKNIHRALVARFIRSRTWFTSAVREVANKYLMLSGEPSPYRLCEAIYPLCAEQWMQVKRDLLTVGFYDERGANWAGKPLFTPVADEQVVRFTFEDETPRRYIIEILWREKVGYGTVANAAPRIVLHQRTQHAEYCVVRLQEDPRATVVISKTLEPNIKRHLFVSVKDVHIYFMPSTAVRSYVATVR